MHAMSTDPSGQMGNYSQRTLSTSSELGFDPLQSLQIFRLVLDVLIDVASDRGHASNVVRILLGSNPLSFKIFDLVLDSLDHELAGFQLFQTMKLLNF